MALTYCEYEASRSRANVVVDGSPNAGTVLTLTHWPGMAQPPGSGADLSAQMAFRYVRSGADPGAEVVTNNHFDQDGLASMLAFVEPDRALAHEELLIDLAAAGDFGTYRFREAARASMVVSTYSDAERSPIAAELTGPYEQQCAVLYETMLPLAIDLVLDPAPYRDLWADEDAALSASEAALASGAISIEERPDLDLAIVRIADGEPLRTGHRFAGNEHTGAHPMAIHNATTCLRLLEVHGRRYTYTDRYETWVQYRSRRPLPRVDLRPLAAELTANERATTTWSASGPSALTPELTCSDESTIAEHLVLELLIEHLETSTSAWDPYAYTVSDTT